MIPKPQTPTLQDLSLQSGDPTDPPCFEDSCLQTLPLTVSYKQPLKMSRPSDSLPEPPPSPALPDPV